MKKIVLLALLCLGITYSQAQEVYNSTGKTGKAKYKENQEKKGFDPNKLVFGGGLGLAFGTITNIYVAPSIGYRFADNFAAGITLGYNYYNQSDYYNAQNYITGESKSMPYRQSIYSGSVWARYTIFQNIMLQAEFEVNNVKDYNFNQYEVDKDGWNRPITFRTSIPSLLLGGGYRQPISEHNSLFMVAMYDVLQDIPGNTRTDQNGQKYSISPYADRIDLRVGFLIGF